MKTLQRTKKQRYSDYKQELVRQLVLFKFDTPLIEQIETIFNSLLLADCVTSNQKHFNELLKLVFNKMDSTLDKEPTDANTAMYEATILILKKIQTDVSENYQIQNTLNRILNIKNKKK